MLLMPMFCPLLIALDSVNSNSTAGAIVNRADQGFSLVPGGKIEPGASVAHRVEFVDSLMCADENLEPSFKSN